ncbi:cation transporting ATPase C-terminal domain-containing protein [Streptomyces sp. NPDC059104]|uniref:cation transporting ATPase C-terminal domain-containing protein n=1 Tax=Streptomyces sp. NPDC059104 TaxID=3346729 RepID=UPI0036C17791
MLPLRPAPAPHVGAPRRRTRKPPGDRQGRPRSHSGAAGRRRADRRGPECRRRPGGGRDPRAGRRGTRATARHRPGNPLLLAGIAFEIVFTAALVYAPPLQNLFGTAALPLDVVLLISVFPPLLWASDEIRRWARRQHHRSS